MSNAFVTSRCLRRVPFARSSAGAWLGLTLCALVLASMLVLPGTAAAIPAEGHITGTVTNAGGTGIEGEYVVVLANSGGEWDYFEYAVTDSNGFYDAGGLPTGSYRLQFWSDSGQYLDEFYDDAATLDAATSIGVIAGSITSGKDATLASGGHITGRVTNPGGTGIEDVYVDAYVFENGEWYSEWGSVTDSSGGYDVGGLPTGTYRLAFEDDYGSHLSEFYDNAATLEDATDVSVTAGATTPGKNAMLAVGGGISGKVTNSGGGGLEDVTVTAYVLEDGDWIDVSDAMTDSSGNYRVGGLPTGTYRLGFYDESGSYASEYYNNVATVEAAQGVSVTAGATTPGKNASLAPAGHITGRVTNPGGAGEEDVEVYARQLIGGEWESAGETYTDPSGNYDLGGLGTGTYRLEFYSGTYVGEFYDNAMTLDSATNIAVTVGSTTSGKNAQLAAPGSITGTVTNPGGTGLDWVVVSTYRLIDGEWEAVGGAMTDPTGAYEVDGLPTGTYRLEFWDSTGMYLSEYYDNAADVDSAADVAVTGGSTTSGKNASLAAAGHIVGRITDSGGAGLEDIAVGVYRLVDGEWESFQGSYSDSVGDYDVGGMPTGSYRVQFRDDSGTFAGEYFDDVATIEAASDVAVTAGATTSDKNASLGAAGHITGTVKNPAGAGIEGICVSVYGADSGGDDMWIEVHTDESGAFDAGGLPTGTYRVRFDDFDMEAYLGEYYDDAADFDSAADVGVTTGSATPGIDAVLARAASYRNVYRFRNLQNGFYLWSADESEKATIIDTLSGTWAYEGVAYRINTTSADNGAPLWRFLNLRGGFYLYSADSSERDTIVRTLAGEWRLEGAAYNVSRVPTGRPVWRFRNRQDGTYLLSADPAEKDTIARTLSATWELEGPAFYIAP